MHQQNLDGKTNHNHKMSKADSQRNHQENNKSRPQKLAKEDQKRAPQLYRLRRKSKDLKLSM